MLSETLTDGLNEYRIGPKVRDLRKQKKLGLALLSEHTGLSPALLSKIERGHIFPTLPTLLRIAMVFGVGIEHFFIEEEKRAVAVTRPKDRLQMPGDPRQKSPSFLFESLNFPLPNRQFEAYCAEFPNIGKAPQPHSHDGAELLYMLSGQLAVTVDGEAHELNAGDAIYFDPAALHSYRNIGRGACRALVVVAPAG